ncbi:unnamed protein product [Ixodes persulcatus]
MARSKKKKAAAALLVALLHEANSRKTRVWVREFIRRRAEFGAHGCLVRDLLRDDLEYRRYMRMDLDTFNELADGIREHVTRQDTLMRPAITVEEQLDVTLRFLATGESFTSLHYQYRMGVSTVREKVMNVCSALYLYLQPSCMKFPSSAEEWLQIAAGFEQRWEFPNCIGALDGKHIRITCPQESGSYYYNYKMYYSIVLMALVDADLKAISVHAGVNGRCNDATAFRSSSLFEKLADPSCNFPPPQPLPGRTKAVSHVIVADAAFQLSDRVMRPYGRAQLLKDDKNKKERRVYNVRHCTARHVVESFFGIMSSRFRVLLTTINTSPTNASLITLACCLLSNFIRVRTGSDRVVGAAAQQQADAPEDSLDRLRRTGTKASGTSSSQRDEFKEYFSNEGRVVWQYQCLDKH